LAKPKKGWGHTGCGYLSLAFIVRARYVAGFALIFGFDV
jgi:hypothetical protein